MKQELLCITRSWYDCADVGSQRLFISKLMDHNVYHGHKLTKLMATPISPLDTTLYIESLFTFSYNAHACSHFDYF